MPYLLKELVLLFPGSVYVTPGWDTKRFRESNSLDKQHYIDAYCVACSVLEDVKVSVPSHVYKILQFRRHDRANIKRQTERTYKLGKETVAKNRHKRMDQKEPSLEEWFNAMREKYGEKEAETIRSRLIVKRSKRSYNNLKRPIPGSVFLFDKKKYILSSQLTNGKYYRGEGCGNINFPASKCTILKFNEGLVYAA